jgi:hypothetical protein
VSWSMQQQYQSSAIASVLKKRENDCGGCSKVARSSERLPSQQPCRRWRDPYSAECWRDALFSVVTRVVTGSDGRWEEY